MDDSAHHRDDKRMVLVHRAFEICVLKVRTSETFHLC